MKLKNKKIIAIIIFLGLSFIAGRVLINSALAEDASNSWDQYTPLAPLPGTTQDCVTDEKGNINCTTDIQTYVPGIFKLAIGIAGVLAVLMIIIGGVEYITTDAIQGKSDGKARIQNALRGLVLVLVSWILLYTINPKLTVFNLNVEKTTSETNYNEDTSDNPYINEGESATELEQTKGSSSSVNKFKQGGSNSSENDDVFMRPITPEIDVPEIPEEIDWSSEPIAI